MPTDRAEIIKNLGPLAALAGLWEGSKGDDTAPSDDRGTEKNYYHEQITFEPFGPVDNHEQKLWGLRYKTVAYRHDENDPFHEETGYWLWDAREEQLMRIFLVPRGVSVLAGGRVAKDARSFDIHAECGSEVYGICSNPFLDREFKTVRYKLSVVIHEDDSFSYEEDTVLRIPSLKDEFHHIDKNRLYKVKDL